jgi:hypothetical protein
MTDCSAATASSGCSGRKGYFNMGFDLLSKEILGVDVLSRRARSHIANVILVICLVIESSICCEDHVAIAPSGITDEIVSTITREKS